MQVSIFLFVRTTFSMDILEPIVVSGRDFACTNICTFLDLSQIFEALPGFFPTQCAKKKPGKTSKFLGIFMVGADIGTSKFSARSDHRFPIVQLTGNRSIK